VTARVALVLVSHSAQVAAGTAAIAEQMAPDVLLLPAGGTADGIGTSVDLVLEAVERGLAETGDGGGVVVLTDLGSAVLTTDLVLEMVDEPERVAVPTAPFVEGAVSAAVKAQQGGDLAAVARSPGLRRRARPSRPTAWSAPSRSATRSACTPGRRPSWRGRWPTPASA
jgi:PTS hybrid protein